MGIERQPNKVKIPELSALALSACLTFLKPGLNLQNSRPIQFLSVNWERMAAQLPYLFLDVQIAFPYCERGMNLGSRWCEGGRHRNLQIICASDEASAP